MSRVVTDMYIVQIYSYHLSPLPILLFVLPNLKFTISGEPNMKFAISYYDDMLDH